MSYNDLVKGLKQEAEDKVAAVWAEARKQVKHYREETDKQIEYLRGDSMRLAGDEGKNEARKIVNSARRDAGKIRLRVESEIGEKLYRIAIEMLGRLRGNGSYEAAFRGLVEELPDAEWCLVKVHPSDVPLAEKYFSKVKIVADDSITGGVAVETDSGLTVVNTFSKRLERGWYKIMPDIMREVMDEISKDADT